MSVFFFFILQVIVVLRSFPSPIQVVRTTDFPEITWFLIYLGLDAVSFRVRIAHAPRRLCVFGFKGEH